MTRQPKTPRTRWHLQIDRWREALGLAKKDWGYRRRKKGRRAKSGQWWRRPKASWLGVDWGIEGEDRTIRRVIDEHHDSRRVMEALCKEATDGK